MVGFSFCMVGFSFAPTFSVNGKASGAELVDLLRQVVDGHGLVSAGGPAVESTFRDPFGQHGACMRLTGRAPGSPCVADALERFRYVDGAEYKF